MDRDKELIAVITTALSLYSKRPQISIKIRSIKRLKQSSPVWASAGRLARMERRLNS